MKKLYILRGLPGSGKSYLAKELASKKESIICSADDYFTYNGEYFFDREFLGEAHRTCRAKAKAAMALFQVPVVIIDNTNTTKKEFKDYISMAKQYGYNIEIKIPDTAWAFDVDECFKRNTHKVPVEAIQKMKNRWEN